MKIAETPGGVIHTELNLLDELEITYLWVPKGLRCPNGAHQIDRCQTNTFLYLAASCMLNRMKTIQLSPPPAPAHFLFMVHKVRDWLNLVLGWN